MTLIARSSLFRVALLSGLALGAPLASLAADSKPAAVPAEPAVTTASYGNWVLRCVNLPAGKDGQAAAIPVTSCEVSETVQVQGQAQPVAQIALGRIPGDKTLILTAVLPSNIAIPGMVHISGNGKTGADEEGAIDMSWNRCAGGACFATAKPDASAIKTLRSGKDGHIRLTDASGRVISIPLSWNGLDQALTALDKQG
ncbi:invasion protein IalB [Ciceribacter lividus]|uniref:Invasion protein IalB n=1 Tax=Ciceribacter lividus TaxID=1197950 RepID=A0A6I7HJI1_9HYPH|nr:invasion associated locus B family protein [Ciceribacter lividus]RCW20640.1 invasion protein IalB [Ciceribacter lividus]